MAASPKQDIVPRTRTRHKRGDGEGSLYLDERRGLWIGELMVGYRPDGKPDRRRVSAKTQAECQRKLDTLKRESEHGILPARDAERETLAAFLARWLQAIRATVRPRTAKVYADYTRLHILPELGRHKLTALRPEYVQALYAHKLAAGLAPATVRKIHSILHRALHDAVRWSAVPRNVADVVDAPPCAGKSYTRHRWRNYATCLQSPRPLATPSRRSGQWLFTPVGAWANCWA